MALTAAAAAPSPESGSVVGRVTPSPLWLTLRLKEHEAPAGRHVQATATLHNLGSVTLRDAVLELRTDPAGLVVTPKRRSISQLKRGKSRDVHWRLCGRIPGSYVIVARAVARDDAGTLFEAESEGELLTIKPARHAARCDDDDEDDEDDD